MTSKLYKQIRTYYLFGYGCPVKRYDDNTLDAFSAKGMLTGDEVQSLKDEKRQINAVL